MFGPSIRVYIRTCDVPDFNLMFRWGDMFPLSLCNLYFVMRGSMRLSVHYLWADACMPFPAGKCVFV